MKKNTGYMNRKTHINLQFFTKSTQNEADTQDNIELIENALADSVENLHENQFGNMKLLFQEVGLTASYEDIARVKKIAIEVGKRREKKGDFLFARKVLMLCEILKVSIQQRQENVNDKF